jgi:hypothetical protein
MFSRPNPHQLQGQPVRLKKNTELKNCRRGKTNARHFSANGGNTAFSTTHSLSVLRPANIPLLISLRFPPNPQVSELNSPFFPTSFPPGEMLVFPYHHHR